MDPRQPVNWGGPGRPQRVIVDNGWRWADLSPRERWSVWWGVAWRNMVVYLGLVVGMFVVGFIFGAFNP